MSDKNREALAVRGGMTMTVVEEETDTPICSVCARPTGFGDEDRGEPPVNLARCPAPGGTECRAVAQAVAPWRRENETLRSNCDHLSSENASLASQVESMAMRIESLAEELGKPEDVRLLAALPLPPEVVAKVGEADRLRKLFDDAGQGEHNVLALIDHYQRNSMDADERLRAVRKLLEDNGCECPCDHHWEECGPDCEICLACLIGEAVGKGASPLAARPAICPDCNGKKVYEGLIFDRYDCPTCNGTGKVSQ